jgi:DNA-directed RNA polymerase specialized sigma24 family protein
MINRDQYLEMRERFRHDGGITPELYGVLMQVVRVVVFRTSLPPSYSPTGHWDKDSAEDAAHGWIERRLLQTNALLAAFDLSDHHRPFLLSLQRNFRHYLENERERDELSNLLSRTRELLHTDDSFRDWVQGNQPATTWWGLASWKDAERENYQGNDADLVSAAWSLGEVKLFRYSPRVERASPVLSTETLREFLTRLFAAVDRLLTIGHLAEVYRGRFDLDRPPPEELTEAMEDRINADPEGEATEEEVRAAARSAIADLTSRQAEALIRRHRDETLEQIAEALGVSRGTADNEIDRAAAKIDTYCVDGVTRVKVLEIAIDALS